MGGTRGAFAASPDARFESLPPLEVRKALRSTRHFPIRTGNGRLDGLIALQLKRPHGAAGREHLHATADD